MTRLINYQPLFPKDKSNSTELVTRSLSSEVYLLHLSWAWSLMPVISASLNSDRYSGMGTTLRSITPEMDDE